MKIACISDSHTFHDQIIIPKGIDMVIHSGDCSNVKSPLLNINEVESFLKWFELLTVKYKVFIAGNHDTSVQARLVNPHDYNIIYLEHESITIEGIKIFGSPYTPEFHDWAFNVRRDRLHEYWQAIPEDTDILVTHGPPKGILDLAYHATGMEYCGDNALLKRVRQIQPKYHIFGHIHNNEDNINAGTRTINGINTTFVNASCVTDGQFSKGITNQPIIINI